MLIAMSSRDPLRFAPIDLETLMKSAIRPEDLAQMFWRPVDHQKRLFNKGPDRQVAPGAIKKRRGRPRLSWHLPPLGRDDSGGEIS
jgi:hypothetical protein